MRWNPLSLFDWSSGGRASACPFVLACLLLVVVPDWASASEAALQVTSLQKASIPEGGSFAFELTVTGPDDCKEIEVQLDILLGLRSGTFHASASDIESISVDGKETNPELPLEFVLRQQSASVVIRTLDDDLAEADEVAIVEVRGGTRSEPNIRCVFGSGKKDSLELATKVTGIAFTIVDNDAPPIGDEETKERPIATGGTEATSPRVVKGSKGRRAVMFTARDEQGKGTFVQIFDRDGAPLTEVVRVGGVGESDGGRHALALLPGGRLFVVRAASSDGGQSAGSDASAASVLGAANGSVVGRFFSPEGVPQGDVVLAEGVEGAGVPAVEADSGGNVAVTWQQEGGGRGRVLGLDGQPRGPELDLGAGGSPVVGSSASGQFVTAWVAETGGIFAQRFDEVGQPAGGTIGVTSSATADELDIAANDEGAFVVVWTDETQFGSDVFARRFSPGGASLGNAFVVHESRVGDQTAPRVDANAAGDFAVVWESDLPPPSNAASVQGGTVLGRFFSSDGAAVGGDETIATASGGLEPAAPDVAVDEGDQVTVVVERRGADGSSEGVFEKVVQPSLAIGTCTPDQQTLCLSGGRFRVRATWQDAALLGGGGNVRQLTDDTGTFWFFSESNLEAVIKVLNGCALNGRYWVFGAGLTDVEVNVVVDDVVTGKSRSYFKPIGQEFAPIVDTDAFATCDAAATVEAAAARGGMEIATRTAWADLVEDLASAAPSRWDPQAAAAPLLLGAGGRFRVDISWSTAGGQAGAGEGVGVSADTGTFWFFDPSNVEMLIKVLDGCAVNDRYWVFAGGLTDTGVVVTVTDTSSGAQKVYENPVGKPFRPVRDTEAFGGCS